jgi:hypothetical protein
VTPHRQRHAPATDRHRATEPQNRCPQHNGVHRHDDREQAQRGWTSAHPLAPGRTIRHVARNSTHPRLQRPSPVKHEAASAGCTPAPTSGQNNTRRHQLSTGAMRQLLDSSPHTIGSTMVAGSAEERS